MPFAVLIVVVVLWTGPWSGIPKFIPLRLAIGAMSSVLDGKEVVVKFNWAPGIGGTAIFVTWLIVALALRVSVSQIIAILRKTWTSDVGRAPGRRIHFWFGLYL